MLKDSVIDRMKTYLYRHRYIKAMPYENGMEDGWVILLPDMPEGEDYINRVFSTESDAEKYITSPLFTREHSGEEYEIVPVMLSILSDDEVENCIHVVPDYRGFEYEFTQVDEESLIVVDEYGAIYTMDKDDFSELYEVTLEEYETYTESKESIELKQQVKKNLRNSLIESGGFDADIIDKIMDVFDANAAEYDFIKKK